MKKFSIIVAVDEENGIGKQGDLAWRLSADLKHFKEVTTKTGDASKKNAVIMGRKTWDSLPEKFRPLPGRLNIVLSQRPHLQLPADVLVFPSLDAALEHLCIQSIESVFVIGGAQVYAQAIHHSACEGLFVTHLNGDFDCDVFFPEVPALFKKVEESELLSEASIQYRFSHYQRVL